MISVTFVAPHKSQFVPVKSPLSVSSTMNAPTEPRLPPELEHIIFELAARDGVIQVLPALMLVARRVRDWLRPMLFQTVVISADGISHPLDRFPPYPTGQETHHVKRLLLHYGYPTESPRKKVKNMPDYRNYVSLCPNVQDFAVWCRVPHDLLSQLTTMLHSPHRTVAPPGLGLVRMSVLLGELFPDGKINFRHEVFHDLTHLEVLDDGLTITWDEENNYGCLPKLKYLAFVDVPDRIEAVRKCLEECKALRVLILDGVYVDDLDEDYNQLKALATVQIDRKEITGDEQAAIGMDTDRRGLRGYRIVINLNLDTPTGAETWVDGGHEGDTMWANAERIVQKRLEELKIVGRC
ncbi:hypothetical protein AX16_004171 [Volvariella volvacea WC 439]|nr:hypothetical protein AX16_004171 [Volvariella volvacea WC 439]